MNKSIVEIQVQYFVDCIEALTPEMLSLREKLTAAVLAHATGMDYHLTWRIWKSSPALLAKAVEYNNHLEQYIKEQYASLADSYNYDDLPPKVRVDSVLYKKFLRWFNRGFRRPTVLAKKLNTSRVTVTKYLDRLKDYEKQNAAKLQAADIFGFQSMRQQIMEDLQNNDES